MADNDYCLGTRIQTPVRPGDTGISIIGQPDGRTYQDNDPALNDIENRRNCIDF